MAAQTQDPMALREALATRERELSVLQHDFALEVRILKGEIESLRSTHRAEIRRMRAQCAAEQEAFDGQRTQLQAQLLWLGDRLQHEQHARAQDAEQFREQREAFAIREAPLATREAEADSREAAFVEQIAAHIREETQRRTLRQSPERPPSVALSTPACTGADVPVRHRPLLSPVPRPQRPVRVALPQACGPKAMAETVLTAVPLPAYSSIASYLGPSLHGQDTDRPSASDPLTAIRGITEPIQARLYEMGITTIEHVAHLGSADVRRITEALGIDGSTVHYQWILDAQSFLAADDGIDEYD